MGKQKWNNDQINFVLSKYHDGLLYKQIAKEMNDTFNLNIGASVVSGIVRRNVKHNDFNYDGVQTSQTVLNVIKGHKMSPRDVLKAHGYNPDDWEIVTNTSNFWKQTENTTLFQSKIRIKPNLKIKLNDFAKLINKKVKPITIQPVKTGKNNLIVPLFDLHFGWTKYDDLKNILAQLMDIMNKGYNNISIIIGGDYFHSNFMNKSQTANNTQLDHVNNLTALSDGTRFFSELLECALKNSNDVAVHGIPGNHDPDKQYMWLYAMEYKYSNVNFNNSFKSRTAFQIGQIGVMTAHGNLALKRLPMVFATEYPQIWSSSTYRIIFTGHFHEEKLTDESGVIIHQCGTPKPIDPYEDKNGFTTSRHKMQVLEFDNKRLKVTYDLE
ncbi:metallophosphoesterase [Lactobacillus acetotolerans]|uniref:metallophosphoesterase n=1 Tax=Lactobacillus acetotolerans TaxID=1600 RepID=UPI002FD87E14